MASTVLTANRAKAKANAQAAVRERVVEPDYDHVPRHVQVMHYGRLRRQVGRVVSQGSVLSRSVRCGDDAVDLVELRKELVTLVTEAQLALAHIDQL